MSTAKQREVVAAVAAARTQLDVIEARALASADHAAREALTAIDDARASMDDAIGRVRRIVLAAYERDTESER